MKWLPFLLLLSACGNPFGSKGALKFEVNPLPRRERLEVEAQKKKDWKEIETFAKASFEEVRPIFQRKCISCHDANFKLPFYGRVLVRINPITKHQVDGLKSLDYSLGFPLQAKGDPSQLVLLKSLRNAVVKRTMPIKIYTTVFPKKKLTPEDEQKLLVWIDPLIVKLEDFEHKYDENDQSLQGRTKRLFQQKCFQCHANGNARGGFGDMQDSDKLARSKYVTVNDPTQSVLYKITENKKMPPNQNEALSEEELNLVREWITSQH